MPGCNGRPEVGSGSDRAGMSEDDDDSGDAEFIPGAASEESGEEGKDDDDDEDEEDGDFEPGAEDDDAEDDDDDDLEEEEGEDEEEESEEERAQSRRSPSSRKDVMADESVAAKRHSSNGVASQARAKALLRSLMGSGRSRINRCIVRGGRRRWCALACLQLNSVRMRFVNRRGDPRATRGEGQRLKVARAWVGAGCWS